MKPKSYVGVVALALVALAVGCSPAGDTSASESDLSTQATSAPSPVGSEPASGELIVFPADNVWNTPIDTLPVHEHSDLWVGNIGRDTGLHPDFGSGAWEGETIGIPWAYIDADTPRVEVSFYYPDESDAGPYPMPADPPIEGGPDAGGDRHVLLVDREEHVLYELFDAWPQADGTWEAGSGAIWDLDTNALRPVTWTSADAAGLPIMPGLVDYDEVASGEIDHALRFTCEETAMAFVWPARHYASELSGEQYPPMGARFRLKADVDISGFSPDVQVILRALKTYGMFVADNGADWFLSGTHDERWDNEMLHEMKAGITGDDFEAVDATVLEVDPDSAEARVP